MRVSEMKILAIESSCDETAAAVVEDGRRVISSVIASQIKEHILYGGVVPEIASRRHAEAISGVVGEALDRAEMNVGDVDAIAVTYAPGLIGALLVGVNFAKGLAFSVNKPLVPVHHLRSHIAANYITHPDLEPPFLALVVSGGHSHIIEVRDYTDFHIIGRTRDDAAGEAMDKAARAMGLDYPGGVNLDRVSKDGDPKSYKLPRPHVDGSEYDFSFSGLKSARSRRVVYRGGRKMPARKHRKSGTELRFQQDSPGRRRVRKLAPESGNDRYLQGSFMVAVHARAVALRRQCGNGRRPGLL